MTSATCAAPWKVILYVSLRRAVPAIAVATLWICTAVLTEISVTDFFQVRTFAESGPDDPVLRACATILDPYEPVAAARLQTENDKFGWLLAATSDEVSSDDLKLFAAAARIIAVALENSHTLSLERAAARVEVERELYQSMVKTAPVGLFRADSTGRVLYVSDRWCEVTGVSEADAMRDGWLCAVHDDDLTRVTVEWEAMLVEGTPVRSEHRCRRDGHEPPAIGTVRRRATLPWIRPRRRSRPACRSLRQA